MEFVIIGALAIGALVLFRTLKSGPSAPTEATAPPTAPAEEISLLDQALALLDDGEAVAGERLLAERIHELEAEPATWDFALAQADLGRFLVANRDLAGAEACFRLALEVAAESDAQHETRMGIELRLAEVLGTANQLEAAQSLLESALAAHVSRFGSGTIPEAQGLELLCIAKVRGGETAAGLKDVQAAVMLRLDAGEAGEAGLAHALTLRAYVTKMADGLEAPAFEDVTTLDDTLVADIALRCCERARGSDPHLAFAVLAELELVLREALGGGHEARLAVLAQIAETAGQVNAHAQRVQALEMLVAEYDGLGLHLKAFEAVLASGGAYGDAGVAEAAEAAFGDAMDRADRIGGLAMAQASSARGAFYSEQARWDEAIEAFEDAARWVDPEDPVQRGEAQAILGVTLMHAGRDPSAALQIALEALPEDHMMGLLVRQHAEAYAAGTPCSCGSIDDELSEALMSLIEERAPEGLLAGVEAALDRDGGLKLEVSLHREPSQAEQLALQLAIEGATRDYQAALEA